MGENSPNPVTLPIADLTMATNKFATAQQGCQIF
jgi:hypothetical protein